MFINICFVETFATEGIESRGFTETNSWVSRKELVGPPLTWPITNDTLKFELERVFTERPPGCTSVLNPVHQNLLLRLAEYLLMLLGLMGRLMMTEIAMAKSIIIDKKLPLSSCDLAGWVCMKPCNGFFDAKFFGILQFLILLGLLTVDSSSDHKTAMSAIEMLRRKEGAE